MLTTSQPVTINLEVGFQSLGPGILGSTGSARTIQAAINVSNRIAARQFGAFDAALVRPTFHDGEYGAGTALNMFTPGYTGVDASGVPYGINNGTKVFDTDGKYNATFIAVNTANARALGYNLGGTVDGRIQFSSDFKFDFNPRNGITPGSYDFYAVAIHEIGHALGFVSGVDDYDFLGTGGPAAGGDCGGFACQDYPAQEDWWGTTLDLSVIRQRARLTGRPRPPVISRPTAASRPIRTACFRPAPTTATAGRPRTGRGRSFQTAPSAARYQSWAS